VFIFCNDTYRHYSYWRLKSCKASDRHYTWANWNRQTDPTQGVVTSCGLHVYFLVIMKTGYISPILTYCHDLPVHSWWRMGMITRVRARLQSVNTPTKIDPRIQDEKTAQTGEKIISTAVRFCNYSCPFGTIRSAWSAYKLSLRPVWSPFKSLTFKPHSICYPL